MRWFWLPCAAAGCRNRRIGSRLGSWCPHRIQVAWRPHDLRLIAVVEDERARHRRRTIVVPASLTALVDLRARLNGVAVLPWWVRLRLIWAMWRTAERQAAAGLARRDAEWAAWVAAAGTGSTVPDGGQEPASPREAAAGPSDHPSPGWAGGSLQGRPGAAPGPRDQRRGVPATRHNEDAR